MEFGIFKEPKNIIELFTFDLSTFFYEDDYEEISCVEDGGVFMIEYEKNLPWTEVGLFNSVVFRVFNDKKNIIGSNHINVRFSVEYGENNKNSIVKLINKLYKIYGWDDENRGKWSEMDDENIEKSKLIRQWTLGEGKYIYTVHISMENNILLLEILFFNHLLKLIQENTL
jgi:hypothetical protein